MDVLIKCAAVVLMLGIIIHAWRTWPRREEDRWDEPSSGLWAFGRFFDFFD